MIGGHEGSAEALSKTTSTIHRGRKATFSKSDSEGTADEGHIAAVVMGDAGQWFDGSSSTEIKARD